MKKRLWIALAFLALIALISPALANSAEPPGLTVLVSLPPEDLEVSLRLADGQSIPLQRETRAWETYYRFYYHAVWSLDNPSLKGAALEAHSSAHNLSIPLPDGALDRYNSLATLRLSEGALSFGRSLPRQILLIAMRVALTLVIEGLVFRLFRYRRKASWTLFLIVNLVTQGALNILLNGGPDMTAYWIFGYLLLEILIFAAEIIAYVLLLREHTHRRAVLCALAANAASLVLGGALLSYLPV